MRQNISKTVEGRITTARLAVKTAAEYPDIVLHVNTADAIQTDIAATLTARKAVQDAILARRTSQEVLRSIVSASRTFATDTRDTLKKYLGKKYSLSWTGTGFKNSLRIPRTAEELEPLIDSLGDYLTAHPDYVNEKFNVTADRATSLFNDLLNDRKAVETKGAAVETKQTALREQSNELGDRLRALFEELKQLLDPLDPRWSAFGFNKPGAKPTPDVPENVTAALIGPNAAAIKWELAPRAEHYRVWKKVVGHDEEFVPAGSPVDLDFTIEGLPANSTIEIAVSAVNNGGESGKSTVVTVVTR